MDRTAFRWLMVGGFGGALALVPACGSSSSDTGTSDAGAIDGGSTDSSVADGNITPVDTHQDASSCTGSTTDCSGACVNLSNDNANCGTCGNACATGTLCSIAEGGTTPTCQLQCSGATSNCDGTCTDLTSTKAHCGDCATACNGTQECCSSTCKEMQTDNDNCGACNNKCGGTESCAGGTCGTRLVGNGADGAYAPVANETINQVRSGGASATAGQKSVTVTSVTGFAVNDLVLVHQSRGTNAGKYEYAQVAAIDAVNNKLTMLRNLTNAYASDGDVNRAQVVRVHQYTTVTIAAGITVDAPAWDGTSGGILAFKASGAVSIAGALDMTGHGYQGFSHAGACAAGTKYVCTAQDTANGFYGESYVGPAAAGITANGSGGGGGADGQDCGAGGGGAYGGAATKGSDGSAGGGCRAGAQPGGEAGAMIGDADLTMSLFFGGAGGEGGGDEDGAYPGKGGNGGGIVVFDAASVTVTGTIASNGAAGGNGVQNAAGCAGGGSGMGGGGAGAGGAVHIRATGNVDVGAALVKATGATGGTCAGGGPSPGGSGSEGRIGVIGAAVTGTTTPAADAH